MSSEIKRRGKHRIYYANVTYMGVRLRDCLDTVDRNEAQHRLTELRISVERGEYQRAKQTFDDLLEKYKPKVLILDPFIRFHTSDENSSSKMSIIFAKIRQIIEDLFFC